MKANTGAQRRALMTRQLNSITVGLAVTGVAATGVLMVTAAAQSSSAPTTPTDATATTATSTTDEQATATSDDDSLQATQVAVTTTNARPVATSGGS